MIRLDHFVINIDNDMARLNNLAVEIKDKGYPFKPKWGKGTKGFKVANIWMGLQYFEMVWLKKIDGGGWKEDWVKKYNSGHRGLIAIYLMTDSLDEIWEELLNKKIEVSEPERISFKWFFGLFKKTMPWRSIFTPPIPGTDIQICFGELDSEEMMEKMKEYMVPNSKENGIEGIREANLKGKFNQDGIDYIKKIFPQALVVDNKIVYDMGETRLSFEMDEDEDIKLELKSLTTNKELQGKGFEIENVQVINVVEKQCDSLAKK